MTFLQRCEIALKTMEASPDAEWFRGTIQAFKQLIEIEAHHGRAN